MGYGNLDDQQPRQFGEIDFTGKDIAILPCPFDRIAVSGRGELLLLSVIADAMRIKQMRAILCGGAKAIGNAAGVRVGPKGCDPWRRHTPGRVTPTGEGYNAYTHKLGYGMAHAMFVTRMPGFMKVVTPESLWRELKDNRYTTPILREWVPYVERELRSNYQLEDADCFNCECGVLTASTKALDKIVSDGLSSREILIPEFAADCSL